MGERYLISGVQLGILIALCENDSKKCKEEIKKILDNQFLGNSGQLLQLDLVRLSGIFNNK